MTRKASLFQGATKRLTGLAGKSKHIQAKSGAVTCLQKRHYWAEHREGIKGTAKVTCGDKKLRLIESQSIHIPLGEIHRLTISGNISLKIIEMQSGSYLGKEDIVRFEDHYWRSQA